MRAVSAALILVFAASLAAAQDWPAKPLRIIVPFAPDGYTLLLAFDGTMVINPHVFARVPFDTLADFAPVTKLGDATLLLVAHPSLAAKTLPQMIDQAKARPLAYGTSGTGGTPHRAGDLLKLR